MELFISPISNPCRQVLLVGNAVGVEFDLKELILLKGEHLTEEFLKINPQHTVPTLIDEDLIVIESKAIIMYLVDKYGEDDSLYPREPQARALVNQRLLFDVNLYSKFEKFYIPRFRNKAPADPMQDVSVEKAFQQFDKFLEGSEFVVGEQMTIADMCLVTTVSTFEVVGIDVSQYPNVWNWYQNMLNTMPGLDIHKAGVSAMASMVSGIE